MVIHRATNWARRYKPLFMFFRYKLYRYSVYSGIEIPWQVEIGKGFKITHYGAITINKNTIIGNNVNITKGVTIGQENRGFRKGAPQIGSNVWIGPNSIVVGNIKIGNNVLIAGGGMVNFDVPDNSIVLGNPGRILSNDHATDEYILNEV
jgi:serine O-acetyltransferase